MNRDKRLLAVLAFAVSMGLLATPKAHAGNWAPCGEVNVTYTEGGTDTDMKRKADIQALHQTVIGNACGMLGLRGLPVFPDAHHGYLSVVGYDTWALGGWQLRLAATIRLGNFSHSDQMP